MNKYQEALETVEHYYVSGAAPKSIALLQELVSRATPMKPDSYHNCPKCYAPITRGQFAKLNDNFCPHCGQSLEWEQGEKK